MHSEGPITLLFVLEGCSRAQPGIHEDSIWPVRPPIENPQFIHVYTWRARSRTQSHTIGCLLSTPVKTYLTEVIDKAKQYLGMTLCGTLPQQHDHLVYGPNQTRPIGCPLSPLVVYMYIHEGPDQTWPIGCLLNTCFTHTLLRSLIRLNSIWGSPFVARSRSTSKAVTILSSWLSALPVFKRFQRNVVVGYILVNR